MARPS